MRTVSRSFVLALMALGCLVAALPATATTITWLNMSPTPVGSPVPNGSVYYVPGVGNVTVTFNVNAPIAETRESSALYQVGSVPGYSWSNYEYFGTYFTVGPDPLVPLTWDVTFTFPGLLPAGTVYVGSAGLGQTSSFGGGASVYTIRQNGLFLGDCQNAPGVYGPTLFTPLGPGVFSLQNSLTGAGGYDPWWNTPLGVTQITDPVSSLTVYGSQIRGDGIGVNVGFDSTLATPAKTPSWGQVKRLYR